MSERDRNHRRALVALGLILAAICLVSLFEATARHYAGQEIAKYQSAYPEGGNAGDDTQIIASLREFDPREDTYAQWMMAAFGVVATLASVFAVVLLKDTLAATREAVRAADDAVGVSREMGQAQVRAYVSISNIEVPADTHKRSILSVRIALRNHGHSPAHDNVCEFCAAVAVDDGGPSQLMTRPDPMPRPSRATLPAQTTNYVVVETEEGSPIPDVYAALAKGEVVFLVWGWTQYVDVFGDPHETTFQWFMDKKSLDSGLGFRADSVGNSET